MVGIPGVQLRLGTEAGTGEDRGLGVAMSSAAVLANCARVPLLDPTDASVSADSCPPATSHSPPGPFLLFALLTSIFITLTFRRSSPNLCPQAGTFP